MEAWGIIRDGPAGGLLVALGVGLLIGVERERSAAAEGGRAAAGVRTFTLAALLGAAAALLDAPMLAVALGAGIALLATVSHLRTSGEDPGLTSEVALLVTFTLGVLALGQAQLAAALGVLVALLLASRSWLHELARRRLSDQELLDAILLAAAALIVLPLLPDRSVDPYGVLNPRVIWALTVVVLLINACGYLALRTLGAKIGLPVTGFVGGFVSSTATIGALGARARRAPAFLSPAIAGASLSSVATVVQLALVLLITSPALLARLAPGLALMGAVAVAYGALFTWRAAGDAAGAETLPGRAFQPRHALVFALTVTVAMLIGAFLADRFGAIGATFGIAFAGLADAHSASASAASLQTSGALTAGAALQAVLLAVSANALTKALVAWTSGGWSYARALWPGLVLMIAALWLGAALPEAS